MSTFYFVGKKAEESDGGGGAKREISGAGLEKRSRSGALRPVRNASGWRQVAGRVRLSRRLRVYSGHPWPILNCCAAVPTTSQVQREIGIFHG